MTWLAEKQLGWAFKSRGNKLEVNNFVKKNKNNYCAFVKNPFDHHPYKTVDNKFLILCF